MANNENVVNINEAGVAAETVTTEATEVATKKKLSKKAKIAVGAGIGAAIGLGLAIALKCLKKKDDNEEILVVESAE